MTSSSKCKLERAIKKEIKSYRELIGLYEIDPEVVADDFQRILNKVQETCK